MARLVILSGPYFGPFFFEGALSVTIRRASCVQHPFLHHCAGQAGYIIDPFTVIIFPISSTLPAIYLAAPATAKMTRCHGNAFAAVPFIRALERR